MNRFPSLEVAGVWFAGRRFAGAWFDRAWFDLAWFARAQHAFARRTPAGFTLLATLLFATNLVAAVGCGPAAGQAPARAPGAKPRVFAPNPALASIIVELAGDAVELLTPWEGAPDPAYWRPSKEAIRAIQSCDLIVLNGAAYEPWAAQAALPRARTVHTTSGVRARLIKVEGETHSHGPEGEHTHSTTASTTWLSPEIALAQTDAIAARLSQLLPQRAQKITERRAELKAVFGRIALRLDELQSLEPKWLASHPVYQYLGQSAGIELESVHWEPGEMPSEEEWSKFRAVRAALPLPTAWMLWEDEPGPEIRAQLEKEGVRVAVVPLFPSGNGAFAASYESVLARICEELQSR
jgi:zinc transport system substrate-binding protein